MVEEKSRGEYDDCFQNQLDYYLEHDRRTFSWYDFHTSYPSDDLERRFEEALVYGLAQSGYLISHTDEERFPATYIVSRIEDSE